MGRQVRRCPAPYPRTTIHRLNSHTTFGELQQRRITPIDEAGTWSSGGPESSDFYAELNFSDLNQCMASREASKGSVVDSLGIGAVADGWRRPPLRPRTTRSSRAPAIPSRGRARSDRPPLNRPNKCLPSERLPKERHADYSSTAAGLPWRRRPDTSPSKEEDEESLAIDWSECGRLSYWRQVLCCE
eukprot:Blabericola_migrator_1__1277@NODE_1330_length_4785_cov_81_161933_g893_i0_p3_GENE_NODE_1330_length_4785_cov_81_161933_g893_i0NODE_1330_length_4785_cov_81_161933_g893_i0_p3_ORF_typecomplete_len187_score20_67_NODE_1330_length_4785_cov_81_161933_g893_i037394299